jgi:hypothetical protein
MVKACSVLLCALLGGCTAASGLFSGSETRGPTPEPPAGDNVLGLDGDGLTVYLQTLRDLIEGDAVTQADAFRSAATAADNAPTTTNRLNLALALATPGHPSSNPREAQGLLNELLAASASLLPEERILALVHLKEVEQRLILDAEAQRLQRAVEAATAQRNDQSAQRLQTALEENRQLQLALNEALAKLDAITNKERSIRERENGADPQ